MATAMKVRGFTGAIVDGGVRDLPQIKRIQFPVFGRGVSPGTSINHYRFAGVNVPVTCAGVKVNPNDIIVADEDGVAVVPRAKAAEVLKRAQELTTPSTGCTRSSRNLRALRKLWPSSAASEAAMSDRSFADLQTAMRGFQESRVLLTAVELDVFTRLARGGCAPGFLETGDRSSRHPGASERASGHGRAGERPRGLSQHIGVGALSCRGSPEYARPALMHTVNMFRSWATLTDCVRAGTAVIPPGVDRKDEEWTASFIAAMHRGAQGTAAQLFARWESRACAVCWMWGADRARTQSPLPRPHRACGRKSSILNPSFRSRASISTSRRRGAGRDARRGFATDDFGEGYDLVLLSSICHMLNPEENQDLIRRCYRALTHGGRIVIRDFILEPDRTAPKFAALFAINMLVGTKSGSTYTEAEYRSWIANAGFGDFQRPDPAGDLIVATR